jgi:hypothetical protein
MSRHSSEMENLLLYTGSEGFFIEDRKNHIMEVLKRSIFTGLY